MPFIVDTENLNPGQVFYFNEKDPEGGSVTLRVCSGAALDEIREKATKKRVEYKRGGRYEVVETDEKAVSEGIWDYSIVDWDLADAKGAAIPCTVGNKYMLMSESPAFSSRVAGFLEKLKESMESEAEAAEKN